MEIHTDGNSEKDNKNKISKQAYRNNMTSDKKNIDLYRLMKLILSDRKKIIVYCLTGAIVGTVIAFSIPKIYKTGVMLA